MHGCCPSVQSKTSQASFLIYSQDVSFIELSYKALSTHPRIHYRARRSFASAHRQLQRATIRQKKTVVPFFSRARNNGTGNKDAFTPQGVGEGMMQTRGESPGTVAGIRGCWVAEVTEPPKRFHK